MKVSELIEQLKQLNPDDIVIISKDSNPSPLDRLSTGAYKAETTWYGEVSLAKLTPEDIAAGYSEEDVLDGEAAVILHPVN